MVPCRHTFHTYLLRRLETSHAALEGDTRDLLWETGHHPYEGLETYVEDLINLWVYIPRYRQTQRERERGGGGEREREREREREEQRRCYDNKGRRGRQLNVISPFVTTSDLAILIVVMANSLYTVDVVPDGLAEIGRIDVLFLPNTNRETISFCNTY